MSHKMCLKCDQPKPLADFCKSKTGKDSLASWCRECFAAYRRANALRRRETNRKWRERNPDYHRDYLKRWYGDPERGEDRRRRRIESVVRWQKKSVNHRLRNTVSARVRKALRRKGHGIFSLLGYTVAQLREHLEGLFQSGMSWDNYGEWHIDHVVPHCRFSYTTAKDPDFCACWALTNLQPLWKADNLRKGSR